MWTSQSVVFPIAMRVLSAQVAVHTILLRASYSSGFFTAMREEWISECISPSEM